MEFWIALFLLLLFVAGIVFLSVKMRGKEKKGGYIAGIAGLSFLSLASLGYALLTIILLGGIK